jgi:hypothetical protein
VFVGVGWTADEVAYSNTDKHQIYTTYILAKVAGRLDGTEVGEQDLGLGFSLGTDGGANEQYSTSST